MATVTITVPVLAGFEAATAVAGTQNAFQSAADQARTDAAGIA